MGQLKAHYGQGGKNVWIDPKIDWNIEDNFNYSDYNRIKNNINYLRSMALELYLDFPFEDMGNDKSGYGDYPYADEFLKIENNLKSLKENTFNFDNSITKTWYENQHTPNYEDFNRIERMCLNFYNGYTIQKNSLRRLPFRLGNSSHINEEASEYAPTLFAIMAESSSGETNYIITEDG